MSEIDWAALQTEAATAGLLPDGDYQVIVIDATATNSSTNKPMIKTKMRVTEGPQKDKPVWTQFTVSPESPLALRIFFQHMAAFGLDSSFFAKNPPIEHVAKTLLNRGAVVTLGTRAWQGQDRNEVKGLSPLPLGGPLPPGLVTGSASASPTAVSPMGGPPVPGTPPTVSNTSTPAVPAGPPPSPF